MSSAGPSRSARPRPAGRSTGPPLRNALPGCGRWAQLARQLLWLGDNDALTPAPFHAREAVVGLVRYHGLPLWVLDDADPQRAAIRASMATRCDLLALVADAEVRGRRCADLAQLRG